MPRVRPTPLNLRIETGAISRVQPFWGTPRVSCQSAYQNPTRRGLKDLPTQLKFWDEYARAVPDLSQRGNRVSAAFCEWMMGLPQGWTLPAPGVACPLPPPPRGRLRAIDLFSGVGGLSLGLSPWFETVVYCEANADCRDVLRARMRDGCLDEAPILDDVRGFSFDGQADAVVAGFPCTGVSSIGRRNGLDNEGTGLWTCVEEVVGRHAPDVVVLENVAAILCANMRPLLDRVSGFLLQRGYSVRYCVLAANEVGAPHIRKRFFLLATKPGVQLLSLIHISEPTRPY